MKAIASYSFILTIVSILCNSFWKIK